MNVFDEMRENLSRLYYDMLSVIDDAEAARDRQLQITRARAEGSADFVPLWRLRIGDVFSVDEGRNWFTATSVDVQPDATVKLCYRGMTGSPARWPGMRMVMVRCQQEAAS